MSLKRVEYEVFGKVQGVYFRKYTDLQANKLKLKGWVKNTDVGTVVGVIEGPGNAIQEMKTWLQTQGSPKSKIQKAVFKNEESISGYSFKDFSIKRP